MKLIIFDLLFWNIGILVYELMEEYVEEMLPTNIVLYLLHERERRTATTSVQNPYSNYISHLFHNKHKQTQYM